MGFYHKVTCDKCGAEYELKDRDYGRLQHGWQDFEQWQDQKLSYFVFCPNHSESYRKLLQSIKETTQNMFEDWMMRDDT